MKTQIFNSYKEFCQREDKDINGVSVEFAAHHEDYSEQNETNKGCWNCSDCYDCSKCSKCSGCYRCSDCSDCSDCYRCSGCLSKNGENNSLPAVPVLKDIHKTVLDAASQPKALDMSDWHTCDTTHCRAGWVVSLAGKEGKALEKQTTTLFAAMQIYKKSSEIKVSPVRFFETGEQAMSDMKRCADEEAA